MLESYSRLHPSFRPLFESYEAFVFGYSSKKKNLLHPFQVQYLWFLYIAGHVVFQHILWLYIFSHSSYFLFISSWRIQHKIATDWTVWVLTISSMIYYQLTNNVGTIANIYNFITNFTNYEKLVWWALSQIVFAEQIVKVRIVFQIGWK